jgi:hypothetical protein
MKTDPHKELLEGQPKPTIEQVSWVFAHLRDGIKETGSYRYMIYHRLGFDQSAYCPLYLAGGMDITNAFIDAEEFNQSHPPQEPEVK